MAKRKGSPRLYLRVIDANLNRSREGLRVVEDVARFVLKKKALYEKIRALRHRLSAVTRAVYPRLLKERDSEADYGRAIREEQRTGLRAVVIANIKRAEEALRVLEEFSRFVSPQAGPAFKQIRFAVYGIEKNILAGWKET